MQKGRLCRYVQWSGVTAGHVRRLKLKRALARIGIAWSPPRSPDARTAASQSAPPPRGRARPLRAAKTIGVSIQNREAQFYQDMESGMSAEAAKYGYTLIVVDASRDNAKQQSQVEDFISKERRRDRADAVRLAGDRQRDRRGEQRRTSRCLPPTSPARARKGNVVAHIASDNVQGGCQAGKLICQAVGKQRQRRDHRRARSHERARSRQRLQTGARAALSRRDDRRRRRLRRRARQGQQRHRRHPAGASRPQGHLRHQRRFGARRARRGEGRRPDRQDRDRRLRRDARGARRDRGRRRCTATRFSIREDRRDDDRRDRTTTSPARSRRRS